MKTVFDYIFLISLCLSISLIGCESEDETPTANKNTGNEATDTSEVTNNAEATDISVLSKYFTGSTTTFTINEKTIVITAKSVPDHKSVYYETSNPLYEAYSASDFKKIPNTIVEQLITMTVDRFPAEDSKHEATPGGTFGVAVNSVSLFNQRAAPGDVLEDEIVTFDQWEGHAQMQGIYHYHLEPIWLTQKNGNEALIGILLDGFPVYGTHENGKKITNADLDVYHGHTSATADFPKGIYHYHITDETPYINGDGFYGTMGTITK